LKLIFVTVSSAMSLLRLSHREEWRKDAETLMLRRQLAVALRERPRAAARLTWPGRAWLALLAGTLPIDRLAGIPLIVTPATILRWHRDVVRRRAWHRCGAASGLADPHGRWHQPGTAPGRPGLGRIPAVRAQAMLAPGFFTADLLNGTKACILAVTEHDTRPIRVPGATDNPIQSRVVQQARNLMIDLEDAGMSVKFVPHDRDASFTAAFGAVFRAAGVRVVRSAIQAPRMNSIMERWIGSCRRELPDRTLIWNQRHLMTVLREYEDSATRTGHTAP
jgi:putative transposase